MRRTFSLLLTLAGLTTLAGSAAAQTRAVTGRVEDAESHQGIPGAVISAVGGRQATQANEQGQYRIAIPPAVTALDVRALGYKRRQVQVSAGQTTVDVTLEKEALQLSEVVVTGAATTQERRNVATAVTTVEAQAVSEVPAVSVDNALQGKVVGATINMNSGAPGGGGQIQIRGVTTILGNGDPLYVVDGVIISNVSISPGTNAITKASGSATAQSNQDNAVNRLADLNPDEIESVQVLKSAAASAIYGSMATNGVVLITTKRGHTGAPSFRISQKFGQSQPEKLLGSRQFTNGTLAATLGSQTAANQYCPGTASTACPYYNYQSALYGEKPLAFETEATMSGGTDNTKYYASVLDKDDPGTLMNTDARRQDLRFNVDQNLGDRWTANASAGIYRSTTARGFSGNDNTFTNPFISLAYSPAVVDLQAKDASGHYVNDPLLTLKYGIGSNPFQLMQGMLSQENVWRQIGSGTLKFSAYSSPQQSFVLQGTGGFDAFNDNGETYAPPYLQTEQTNALQGRSVQVNANSQQVNGTLSAVHQWTPAGGPGGLLGRLTSATTSFGLQYEERYLNQGSVLAQGLIPGLQNVNQGSPTITQSVTDVRNEAFYGSEEVLAFNEKLSLTGRVRGERSSVNGNQDKFYYWPAGAIAYHIPTFIPGSDDIKLRAAIGLSGNQPLYGSRDVLINPSGVIAGINTLGVPSAVGNPAIRPEQMQEDELGIDATFLNSRVGFEGSVFRRNITDLLLQAALAPTSGFGTEYINGGEMQTKGLELALTLLPIRTRSFTWTSHVSFYSFTSTMISLPVPAFNLAIGSGFGAQYGSGRIAQGYKTTEVWGNLTNPQTGAVTDVPIADGNPRYQMSFSDDFQWRNFTLSGLIDWREGGYVVDMTNQNFDEGQNGWDYDKASPNTAVGATLGAWRYNTWNDGQNIYPYVQNGTFVKLREITLAYRVPQQVSSRFFGGHDARLQLSGRNLYMWSGYWAFDPEVNNYGDQQVARFVDLASYPQTRSFYLGFDVAF